MKRVALPLMLAAAGTAGSAHAQTEVYPARQVRLVASLAPGSSGDTLTRNFAGRLGAQIKQKVHVAYNGSTLFLPDLVSGRVTIAFDNVPVYVPIVNSGKLKVVAFDQGCEH